MPESLHVAATALMHFALEEMDGPTGFEWDSYTSGLDCVAVAAAIRLCMAALCEIDAEAREIARDTAARLRRDLATVEQLKG